MHKVCVLVVVADEIIMIVRPKHCIRIDDENLASHNDPLGSWTGVPDQADEMPTQDQDDL